VTRLPDRSAVSASLAAALRASGIRADFSAAAPAPRLLLEAVDLVRAPLFVTRVNPLRPAVARPDLEGVEADADGAGAAAVFLGERVIPVLDGLLVPPGAVSVVGAGGATGSTVGRGTGSFFSSPGACSFAA
jgi:hypothetical protein